ncbi:hypothetical protein [Brachybacterium hainanense]|uniref:DUF1345 domain-containing protein n=1 Tax=Brachybacterium hainanense TaxID=1541174 RepID=A0ABV6RBN1_9MICO
MSAPVTWARAAGAAARRAAAHLAEQALALRSGWIARSRARRASARGRRFSVRERGLWAWFLPESRRTVVAMLGGLLAYFLLLPLPGFETLRVRGGVEAPRTEVLATIGTLVISVITLYTLISTGLAHWVYSHLDRREFVVLVRLRRAQLAVRWYRWAYGRAGARSEAQQMLATCAIAVIVLLLRPPQIPVALPLVITAGAVVATWISCVVGFAEEYAAEDGDGTALLLPEIPAAERGYEEYLDMAVLVQTTSGPTGPVGLTRRARRAVRAQSVLAHVMSTVIISLAVSVVLTALT